MGISQCVKGYRKMIFFRVDVNEEIATGHIMRCITIAQEAKRQGLQILFITADHNADNILIRNDFFSICLDTVWNCMEAEIPTLLNVIENNKDGMDCLVIDSYMVTREYIYTLSQVIKTVYFDDLFIDQYDVDMLINYNLYHSMFSYSKVYNTKKTKLLLGGKYVPLREQFRLIRKKNKKMSGNFQVLLICGGGDRFRILPDVIKKLKTSDAPRINSMILNVVVGMYNHELDVILKQKEQYGNINIYMNVENMAELMSQCDFAVSAASTVLYELCTMKIPTIFFCMADNQKYDQKAFEKEIMDYAGDIRGEREEVLNRIESGLADLLDNPLKIDEMKRRMAEEIDPNGAIRIVEEIKRL